MEPVAVPCIEVRPAPGPVLDAARRAADEFGHVMVSSARTVDVVWATERPSPDVQFYTVGAATAAVVEGYGGSVRIVGDSGLSDLSRLVAACALDALLFPHASGTDLGAIEPLVAAGTRVTATTVYHTESLEPPADPVDAVVFASPSAVDGWLGHRTLDGMVIGAIGPTTASALVRRGIPVDVVPARPGFVELAEAMGAHVIERGRTT